MSSTTISPPRHGSFLPAERAEAKNRTSSAGKLRSSSMLRITAPTWPVAPTTPTRTPMLAPRPAVDDGLFVSSEVERLVQRPDRVVEFGVADSTEIRISEVEISSMLIPASASASQNVAVTPGWLFMPAPTSDTLPMWSS